MSFAVQMTERVLLQAPVTGQDGYGQPLTGWVNVVGTGDGRIWAAVEDQSGREFIAAGATQGEVLTKITIQQRSGITFAMRLVHGADLYNIQAVLRQRDGTLLLMCSRGVSNG